jgi:hypothetical protein
VRMAQAQGLSLTGPDGLLKQPTKAVLEIAHNEEEMTRSEHSRMASSVGAETSPSAEEYHGSLPSEPAPTV